MSYFDRQSARAMHEARARDIQNMRGPLMPSQLDEELAVDHPTYGFKLRRKRANKLISQMLREGGYEDLARTANIGREEL